MLFIEHDGAGVDSRQTEMGLKHLKYIVNSSLQS